jgi:hypothetical protein
MRDSVSKLDSKYKNTHSQILFYPPEQRGLGGEMQTPGTFCNHFSLMVREMSRRDRELRNTDSRIGVLLYRRGWGVKYRQQEPSAIISPLW